MSMISPLTDLNDLDISDTSDIEGFNMSATAGAAAGAAILSGYRHSGIQSGSTFSTHRQLLPQTGFLESFLEYDHSFRYRALRPTFTGPVFPCGSSGALG